MSKIHLRHGAANHTACGRTLLYTWDTTTATGDVDCSKCRKSGAFETALAASASVALRAGENVRIQEVLDIVAKAAWDEAKSRSYCTAFDDIASIADSALPAGLHFRKPSQTFIITLEVEAMDEDDAFETVNDNGIGPHDYVTSVTTKS